MSYYKTAAHYIKVISARSAIWVTIIDEYVVIKTEADPYHFISKDKGMYKFSTEQEFNEAYEKALNTINKWKLKEN